MKHRSPLIGFNHNVRHLGRVYHVQTEDSGVGNPHLFTHLFFGGTILATKRVDYDPSANEALVRSLMQSQHKALLRDLKNGKIDEKIRGFFGRRGGPAQLLDAGPLESEPEEAPPPPEVLAAIAAEDGSVPAGVDFGQLDLPPPPGMSDVAPVEEEGPVIMLAPPPRPVAPEPLSRPMATPEPPAPAALAPQAPSMAEL